MQLVDAQKAAAALHRLLDAEADLRRAADRDTLSCALVDESVALLRARQGFLLQVDRIGGLSVERVSGTLAVERDAPLVAFVEGAVVGLAAEARAAGEILDLAAAPGPEAAAYPYRHALWLPMAARDGTELGGLLVARETAFSEHERALGKRLAETGAHALLALRRPMIPRLSRDLRRPVIAIAGLALATLAFPVSMTVLAPATVAAQQPFVVAAPIDGIVAEVAVEPNARVGIGDLLLRYVDITQRNALAVAEREVEVTEAKVRQVTQGAYADERIRRELGQARAELALKMAERDFARDTAGRTQQRAERAGVAVFADRKEWFGKPVSAGQRILEIADPNFVEIRVDVPVADAIALVPEGRVRVFLDADPLNSLEARLDHSSPVARITDAGVLAYRVVARLPAGDRPRLGAHGTAQLYGGTVPFGFYLFRKPVTFLRQKFGL